jgi:hypothetical protein
MYFNDISSIYLKILMKKYIFDPEELKNAIQISDSFAEVARKLDYDDKNKYHINKIQLEIKKLNINTNHFSSLKRLKKWGYATKEKLMELVEEYDTMKDILNDLNLSLSTKNYKKLKTLLDEYNIESNFAFSTRENSNNTYSKEKLEELLKNCYSYRDACRKLGLSTTGNNNNTLKKYIKRFNIDISHFDPNKGKVEALKKYRSKTKRKLLDILVRDSTYSSTSGLKERLYKEGLKKKKCELCGQGEKWQGKKMSLILDHINGVNKDNRIENLRVVCPNCNATLSTHCGKLSNKERQKRLQEKADIKAENPTGHGEKWKEYIVKQRNVDRPSYDVLLNEVDKHGYSATGRKYGVSDNSIRKWIKYYKKYES